MHIHKIRDILIENFMALYALIKISGEEHMKVSYKPLWHTLLEKGMSKEDLRQHRIKPIFKRRYRKTPDKNAGSIDLCSSLTTKAH